MKLFVVILCVCLYANYVSCLKCYECESTHPEDKSCTDLDPTVTLVNTCPEKSVCRTLKAGNAEKGYSLIRRSCGALMFENIQDFVGLDNKIRAFKEGIAVSSMVCNTDLCNGAAIFKASLGFVLSISFLLLLAFVY